MDLAGDLAKAERGVEVLADFVLLQCFDLGVRQSAGAEVLQGVFDQLPPEATASSIRFDCEVGDVADPSFAVQPRRDATDNAAVDLCHEDATRIASDIVVQMPSLPPLPVVIVNHSEQPLHPLIDRYAVKRCDGDSLERRQVVGTKGTDEHDDGAVRFIEGPVARYLRPQGPATRTEQAAASSNRPNLPSLPGNPQPSGRQSSANLRLTMSSCRSDNILANAVSSSV